MSAKYCLIVVLYSWLLIGAMAQSGSFPTGGSVFGTFNPIKAYFLKNDRWNRPVPEKLDQFERLIRGLRERYPQFKGYIRFEVLIAAERGQWQQVRNLIQQYSSPDNPIFDTWAEDRFCYIHSSLQLHKYQFTRSDTLLIIKWYILWIKSVFGSLLLAFITYLFPQRSKYRTCLIRLTLISASFSLIGSFVWLATYWIIAGAPFIIRTFDIALSLLVGTSVRGLLLLGICYYVIKKWLLSPGHSLLPQNPWLPVAGLVLIAIPVAYFFISARNSFYSFSDFLNHFSYPYLIQQGLIGPLYNAGSGILTIFVAYRLARDSWGVSAGIAWAFVFLSLNRIGYLDHNVFSYFLWTFAEVTSGVCFYEWHSRWWTPCIPFSIGILASNIGDGLARYGQL